MKEIFERRSIRRYTSEKIEEDTVRTILHAGLAAPSAGNEQPWQFVVTDSRELMTAVTTFHPYSQMLASASHAVFLCADLRLKEFSEDYWVQDCAAAAENMLLCAQSLGVGAVWLGVYPTMDRVKDVQTLLGLPEKVVPFCIVSLGRPAEEKPGHTDFDESRIHWGRW